MDWFIMYEGVCIEAVTNMTEKQVKAYIKRSYTDNGAGVTAVPTR
jgi:hypothetical protein